MSRRRRHGQHGLARLRGRWQGGTPMRHRSRPRRLRWYLATCQYTGLPQPFSKRNARAVWALRHTAATRHPVELGSEPRGRRGLHPDAVLVDEHMPPGGWQRLGWTDGGSPVYWTPKSHP